MSAVRFNDYKAIVPSNAVAGNFVFETEGIYVGVSGDIAVVRTNDDVVVFKNAVQGSILAIQCKRVNAAGTTATDLVALRQV